ncbi:MAG TPA: peptide chain release factor 2 [Candidatus Limnocylindria bacterium]|nr:peptide chain release factor 2 [Candidatus Limnocylindria bacterium]
MDEIRDEAQRLAALVRDVAVRLDLASDEAELEELTQRSSDPNLWNDPAQAQTIMRRAEELRSGIGAWRDLEQRASGLAEMAEMAAADPEETASLQPDLERDLAALQADWSRMEQQLLLSEPFDERGAIVSVHAGAGGTESQDWAEMLLRMYLRWAERHGFKTEILEATEGEEAGLKSVSFSIDGRWAYGRLRSERGVHRLVRISPYDSQKRRHTSFALVEIMPEVPEDAAVEIDEKDLRVDTYRSSGAGGQHVNKTDSAVRLTHLPTGIVVAVQSERSQHQNRERALSVLRAKLIERQEQEREAELARLRGEHVEAGWGNQIRSYVLQPYTMVKDLRTNVETSNPNAVLDGELDPFIEGYLRWRVGEGEPTPAA